MKSDEGISQERKMSVTQLAAFWQAWATARTGTVPTSSLSMREIGQLKLLRNNLGEEAKGVIAWTVDNWSRFSRQARAEAGLSSQPALPHIGFLLAHHGTAVNMMAKEVPEQVAKLMASSAKRAAERKASWVND